MGGNQGDHADAGFSGSSAGGLRYADRVDLPFITEPDVAGARTGRSTFKDQSWLAKWYAWRALGEFSSLDWKNTTSPPTIADMQATVPITTAGELNAFRSAFVSVAKRAGGTSALDVNYRDPLTGGLFT